MAWVTPRTWVNGEVPGATEFNQHVRDNLLYLFSGRTATLIAREGAADYSTTSTSFVAVSTTNLRLTLYTLSGRLLVFARGNWGGSINTVNLFADFLLDGTTRAGGTNGLYQQESGSTGSGVWPFTIFGVFTGLSAGNHTVDLAWKVSAGTGTMLNNAEPIVMYGMEI